MYGIDKRMQFNHRVDDANWLTESKTWTMNVTANGSEKKTLRSRWMIYATGYYDYDSPLTAMIPGIDNFKGKVIHPQFWPKDLDYTDKDVTIIGSGATAITLLPVIAEKARNVTMLQRSPSYVMSTPTQDGVEQWSRKWLPAWMAYKLIRAKWIFMPFMLTTLCAWFPNAINKMVKGNAKKLLPPSLPIDPHFTPNYNVFEQRLCFCPDGDFYEALREGKATIETGVIENVTANAIKLKSGAELNPDIIVTATGLRMSIGGKINITVDGVKYNPGEKMVWKGVMFEDLPNAAYVIGYVDASWTLGADATAQMVTRIMNKMKKEQVTEVVPRCSQEEKKSMKQVPVLRLTSTYVKAGMDALPKAGDRGQWRPRSYYYEDILMAWFGDIKSGMEWVRGV